MLLAMLTMFSVTLWAQDVKVQSIELDFSDQQTLRVGETLKIFYSCSPRNATNPEVTITSSNPDIVEITQTSVREFVTAKKVGETVITLTAKDGGGATKSFNLTVLEALPELQQIFASEHDVTVNVGQTTTVYINYSPLNAEYSYYSNGDCAFVGTATLENGQNDYHNLNITGNKPGTMTVYLSSQTDPSIADSIKVTVEPNGEEPYNPGGDDPYNPGGGDDPYNPGGGDDPAGSGVKFASLAEAQQIISQQDEFLSSLNQLDIDARLGKTGGTLDELIEKQKASCLEFTDEEKDMVSKGIMSIMKNLMAMNATGAMPRGEILFVKTTMAEELDAGGYTRGTTIYLGEQIFEMPEAELNQILAHELCHVLTRTNPELKEQLYKAIDFKLLTNGASTADVSADIAERWLSNPDVEKLSAYADFTINGNTVPCAMYIYLDKDYQAGNPVFPSMKTGLIALDDNLKPLMKDGKTVVYSTADATDFYTKMGKNTDYVIDPEECIADNFAFLANGITDKPNPEILQRIMTALTSIEGKPEAIEIRVDSTLYIGSNKTYNFSFILYPENTNANVEFKISDPDICDLEYKPEWKMGSLYPMESGTVELTATCTKYPEITASKTINIINPSAIVEKDFTAENISTASIDWNNPEQVTQFVKQYSGVEMPEDYIYVCTPTNPDIKGFRHYSCKQMLDDKNPYNCELTIHTDANGKMMFMTGQVLTMILPPSAFDEDPSDDDQGSYAKKSMKALSKMFASKAAQPRKAAVGTEKVQLDVDPYYYGKEYLKAPECIGSKDNEGNYILQVPGKLYTLNYTNSILEENGFKDGEHFNSFDEMLTAGGNFTSTTPDLASLSDGLKSNLTKIGAILPASLPVDATYNIEIKKCKFADLDKKEMAPADTIGKYNKMYGAVMDNDLIDKYLLSAINKGTQLGKATGVPVPEMPGALEFSFDNVQFSTPYREVDTNNEVTDNFYAWIMTSGSDTIKYSAYPLKHCDQRIISFVNGKDSLFLGTQHTLVTCQPAINIHWSLQRTLDCYKERFGIDSFDDKGTPLVAMVNYTDNGGGLPMNACADPKQPADGSCGVMMFGMGQFTPNVAKNLKFHNWGGYPFCMMDLTAHEYTHLVARKLGLSDDASALNESYADIMGKMVKRMSLNQHTYATGDDTVEFLSWKLGQENGYGTPQSVVRRFDDPYIDEHPKFYHGKYWQYHGDMHANAGVQNHWFYLLCNGGTVTPEKGETVTVNAIDRDDAELITFSALNYYGMYFLSYPLARKHSIFATRMYYGDDSDELKAVYNAWYAVGVGQDEWQPGMPLSVKAINNVSDTNSAARKLLRNGQLVIVKNGVEYNAAGARVK